MQKWKNLFTPVQRSAGKQLRCVLFASAFSLLMSAVYLVGTTFAWFNDSVRKEYVLEIGRFSASGYMACGEETTTLTTDDCEFPAGVYTLTIQTRGNTIGYCVIRLNAQESGTARAVYCTDQMSSGTTREFTICLNERTQVSMRPVWGKLTAGGPTLESGLIYGIAQEEEKAETESISDEGSSGEDMSNENISGEDTSGGDTCGGDASGEDASGEDMSGEDMSGEDTSGEDTSNEDTSNEDTFGGETSNGNTSGEDTSTESTSTESTSTESTSTGSTATENASTESASTGSTSTESASTGSTSTESTSTESVSTGSASTESVSTGSTSTGSASTESASTESASE